MKVRFNSRRERRMAQRRLQILDAAADVFSHHGYENATTREIAERADVSEGTLYNYFENKYELFVGVADAFADDLVEAVEAIDIDDMERSLTEFFAARLRSGRERRLLMLFLYMARLPGGEQIQEAVSRIVNQTTAKIQAAVEADVVRPLNPAVAAATLSAAVMGFAVLYDLSRDVLGGTEEVIAQRSQLLAAEIIDIALNGLVA